MNQQLEELRELTKLVGSFPPEIAVSGPYHYYEMHKGRCKASGLFRLPEVCVDKWEVTAGTIFPEHKHIEREWIVVLSGKLIITYRDKDNIVLTSGDCVYNGSGIPHGGTFPVDTVFLTIMIPASLDSPGANND